MTNLDDSSENKVARAIAAKTPLIYVVSWEEERLARHRKRRPGGTLD